MPPPTRRVFTSCSCERNVVLLVFSKSESHAAVCAIVSMPRIMAIFTPIIRGACLNLHRFSTLEKALP